MPGLHVSLGIFHRLFTLLEEECQSLDARVANDPNFSGDRSLTSMPFQEYKDNMKEIRKLNESLEEAKKGCEAVELLVTYYALQGNSTLQQACSDAVTYQKRLINEIVSVCSNANNTDDVCIHRRKKSRLWIKRPNVCKGGWSIYQMHRRGFSIVQCSTTSLLFRNICRQPCSLYTKGIVPTTVFTKMNWISNFQVYVFTCRNRIHLPYVQHQKNLPKSSIHLFFLRRPQ